MMGGFITVNRRYKAVEFGTMFDKKQFYFKFVPRQFICLLAWRANP